MRSLSYTLTGLLACAGLFATTSAVRAASPAGWSSPGAMPSVSPTPAPSSLPSRAPAHGAAMESDLSGHIDYTFDVIAVRDSLKQIGVETVPAHYRPFAHVAASGLEFFWINRENDTHGTSIFMMVMQDPMQFVAKLAALKRIHMPIPMNPVSAPKDSCIQVRVYDVGAARVRVTSCNSASATHYRMETATIANRRNPITIYARTTAATFDETPLKQLLNELAASAPTSS